MTIDSTSTTQATVRPSTRTPFLTTSAAGQLADMSPLALARRLVAGEFPAYKLGRQWFVPEREFQRHLRRRAWMLDGVDVDDMINELTARLPAVLDIAELEDFFGVRRAHLYEFLRFHMLPATRGTTLPALQELLRNARNDCPPCRAA